MKILSVTMEAAAPEALATFYEKVLQLPCRKVEEQVEVEVGSTVLIFAPSISAEHPFYHFAFNIPSNKIEEARNWLTSKVQLLWMEDYQSEIADFKNWNAKSIYFSDIGGNIVELIARSDLNNDANQPFSSAQLLSVSEIGIVFPGEDMESNTQSLIQRNGLNYFSKQPPFPQFKAVGDDEGLFIIVSEGRNWYPTKDKPAGRFPLEVTFEVNGKRYEERFLSASRLPH